MPFSFNPGQAGTPGGPAQGMAPTQAQVAANATSAPSVPDSPFLFMRYRDREMPINAYLQILLILVAFLSILASLILFSYSSYLTSSIERQAQELTDKDAGFKDYDVESMKRLSKRFSALEKLMKEYVSVRSPLKILEAIVENQAVFNNFSITRNQKDSGYTMSFSVLTNNYRVLIQQLIALNLNEYSKVIPQKKISTPIDSRSIIKLQITAPVFTQGILSDEVIFVSSAQASSSQNLPVTTSNTTP
jgi:Tfp pilus assembly protein PilE